MLVIKYRCDYQHAHYSMFVCSCGLFNNSFSSSEYTSSNENIFLINNESTRMWSELIMAYYKELSHNVPGMSEESH
jgi:hypothetical protein